MSDDFLNQDKDQDSAINETLLELEDAFRTHNLCNLDFGLPAPIRNMSHNNREYDLEFEQRLGDTMLNMCNNEQRLAVDTILNAIYNTTINTSGNCFFLDGPAGTGKTFVYNTLMRIVRGRGNNVLPVAWTGVAAVLLDDGKTVHSQFGIPLELNETSCSTIKENSKKAETLRTCDLIIWDEAPMATSCMALTVIDRLLKQLMKINFPFGGKCMFLGGDFRQIPPVVIHGNKTTIIENCLKNNKLWCNFQMLKLTINMRAGEDELAFSEWLLKLGDGTLPKHHGLDSDFIEIPDECLLNDNNSIIEEVYSPLSQLTDPEFIKNKSILCPKNEDTFVINENILKLIPGNSQTFVSADKLESENEENNIQLEFLHSLTPSGLPPHNLNLKQGAIVMRLRNLNILAGLCNGTRLIAKTLMKHIVDAEIITGSKSGDRVFLPGIDHTTIGTGLPLRRRQLPLRQLF